jgi:hypothetical protein
VEIALNAENEIRFQFQNKPWHANPSTEEAGRAPRGSAVLQSMESPFNSLGFDLVVIRISGRQAKQLKGLRVEQPHNPKLKLGENEKLSFSWPIANRQSAMLLAVAADEFSREKWNRDFVMPGDGIPMTAALFSGATDHVRQRTVGLNEVKVRSRDVRQFVSQISHKRYAFQKHFRQDYC